MMLMVIIISKMDLLMGNWNGIESGQYLSPQLNKAAKQGPFH